MTKQKFSNILIIDDEKSILEILKEFSAPYAEKIMQASNGAKHNQKDLESVVSKVNKLQGIWK